MDTAQSYNEFARVYDVFQDNVDYRSWADYLINKLSEYGIDGGLVLELGCGTGTMTELLDEAGYDMIGVDNSEEMLSVAMEKKEESGRDILYLLQDMQEFELYGTVRAIVSVCDCMNYLTEKDDLQEVFRLANNYLDPGGIFIFDMNSEYKYTDILGEQTIAENREEGSFIWENIYDPESRINEYGLTLFLPRADGLYEKSEEFHYQRAYSLKEVKDMLKEAGMKLLKVTDAYSDDEVRSDSERWTFIAMEQGK